MNPPNGSDQAPHPPRVARWLLRQLLPPSDRRFALADLDEEYARRATTRSAQHAWTWYWVQLLKSFVPLFGMRLSRLPNESFGADLRYAFRTLRKTPLTVMAIVVSIGLGVGAVTTVFAVASQVLWAPPVGLDEPTRLVSIYTGADDGRPYGATSYEDFRDVVAASPALESAAVSATTVVTLSDAGSAEALLAEEVSPNDFEVMGRTLRLGRTFTRAELAEEGDNRVAVIGHDLWRRRFTEDPGVVGRTLQLDGTDYTIIGVTLDGAVSRRVPLEPDVWFPLRRHEPAIAARLADRNDRRFAVLGRLVAGRTQADVEAQVENAVRSLRAEYALEWRDSRGESRSMQVVSERDSRINPRAKAVVAGVTAFFLGSTGLVLLIACSNVMGLMLARASRRRRELAVRAALGASRWRIRVMLLTEGLLPGVLGGALGLAVAWLLTGRLEGVALSAAIPVRLDVGVDATVVVFAVTVSLVASLAFAAIPALRASNQGTSGLRAADGVVAQAKSGRPRLRASMVVIQCAASAALLTGASLFLRALDAATDVDLGVNTTRMAIATKSLDRREVSAEAGLQYFTQTLERIAANPEVQVAHLSRGVELTLLSSIVRVHGPDDVHGPTDVPSNAVSAGYLETMGIEVLAGRGIQSQDHADAPRVAVVTQAFAERFWPGSDPLGRSFSVDPARRIGSDGQPTERRTLQVVGVAENGKYVDFDDLPSPYFWTSVYQDYSPTLTFVVQGTSSAQEAAAVLSREVLIEEGELQRVRPSPLAEHVALQFVHLRIASRLLGLAGFFGLLLAAIGVYGMVSFAAARRAREMAIRLAVGAGRGQVFRQISAEGVRLAAIGLVIGFALAVPAAKAMQGVLAGVGPLDPPSLLGGAVVLLGVALIASAGPALRSMALQPMETLREE